MLGPAEGPRFDFALLDDQMPGMSGIDLAKRIRDDARLAAMRLIMLTIRDNHDSDSDTVQLFAAILTKPLRRSQLLELRDPRDDRGRRTRRWRTPAIRVGADRGRRAPSCRKYLLVEDNPVNREVAVGMLESLGCAAHAAENGWHRPRAR